MKTKTVFVNCNYSFKSWVGWKIFLDVLDTFFITCLHTL